MNVSSYFIVDNRQLSHRSFNSETSHASYHRHVKNLIGKFLTLSTKHTWIDPPIALLVAQSPDKVRLLNKSQFDVVQLSNVLDPVYTCVGGASIPKVTWSNFIFDGLQKIFQLIQQNERNNKPEQKHLIVLFSTDVCLFGDQQSQDIDESLSKVCKICADAMKISPNVEIRIVCTIISDVVDSVHYDNSNLLAIHTHLKSLRGAASVHQTLNSAMHFEEELRAIVAAHHVPLAMKIQFPVMFNLDCSLVLEARAGSMSSADALHGGMAAPELCSLVSRCEIDSLCIEGKGCVVKHPSYKTSKQLLPSIQR